MDVAVVIALVVGVLAVVAWSPSLAGASTVAPPAVGTIEPISIDGNTGGVAYQVTYFSQDDLTGPISRDGRYVAFCSRLSLDPNHPTPPNAHSCYQRDRLAHTTRLVTFGPDGLPRAVDPQTPIWMTPDGRYIAYVFPELQDVFRYDTQTGTVADIGNPWGIPRFSVTLTPTGTLAYYHAVSADGRYALEFKQPIRVDLQTGQEVNYATAADGTVAADGSVGTNLAAVSSDGRYVVFNSNDPNFATTLGSPCTSGCGHVYRKDLVTGAVSLVDVTDAGQPWVGTQYGIPWPTGISDDGTKVAFMSGATLTNAHVSTRSDLLTHPLYGYVHDFTAARTHLVTGTAYVAASPDAMSLSGDGSTVEWSTNYAADYVTSSDTDVATHALTGLRMSPAQQTWETGPDGAPIRMYGTFDDGSEQVIPVYAWRLTLPWQSNSVGAVAVGDHFLISDRGTETINETVRTYDDTDRAASFAVSFVLPTVTITANDQTGSYGQLDPPFTYTVSGLRTGDKLQVQPTCGVSADHIQSGSYSITCQGAQAPGYNISYKSGTLTVVDHRAVTHTKLAASATSVQYGRTPTYTATVSGSDGDGWVEFDENGTPVPGCPPGPMKRTFGAYQRQCYPNPLPEPGYHHVTATYLGDGLAQPSSATLVKDVLVTAATKLVANPVIVTDPNGVPTYRAVLTRSTDGTPIADMTVTFLLSTFYGASSCTATTDKSGVATCEGARPRRSGGTYTAKFAARTGYSASTGKSTVKF